MATHRLSSIMLSCKNRLGITSRRTRAAVAGAITAAAALTAAVVSTSPAHANQFTYGPDVSSYEPDYNWSASPAKFGIVKATEGLDIRDASFDRHWLEMAKKGIVRGAYHFGHPSDDPIAEADHFLSVVNAEPAKSGDLLVLDLETSDGQSVSQVNSWAKTWLTYVKKKTGVTPLFYSNWDFANTYGEGLASYPLWVAYYGRAQGDVAPPAGWKSWTIHQYTDTPIDQNVSFLSPEQLRLLGRH
ncbi:glycosyl hydrolase [Planotetraspora thailandica]|uniref:Glycosyl hydrolase n=1 Tax=Planotetraspora thailandica TaxID=487172 RepID=A0A8J3XUW4_9ACTN|nr:GH25 family lysozyme [Planotetraspora thailandica]GII55882.1 glycosyl hydrolase [Planotetraspora thailandica]